MQIIVEISQDQDGRAVGTVRAVGETRVQPFSGNLEFLALIESLYRIGTETAGTPSGVSDKESS